jgi:hypothetical protein
MREPEWRSRHSTSFALRMHYNLNIEHKTQKEGATMRFDRCNLNRSFVALLALTLMLSMPLVLAAETADPTIPAASPQQVVEHALAEMRAALFQARGNLKDDPLEIFRAIDHIISHNADIPRISRLMLRRHWWKATDGQREQLVTLFHRFNSKLLTLINSMVSATAGNGGSVNITFLPAHISGTMVIRRWYIPWCRSRMQRTCA